VTETYRTVDELEVGHEVHTEYGWVRVDDISFTMGNYGIVQFLLWLADGKFTTITSTQEILSREVPR
jgi:hypothetical protein